MQSLSLSHLDQTEAFRARTIPWATRPAPRPAPRPAAVPVAPRPRAAPVLPPPPRPAPAPSRFPLLERAVGVLARAPAGVPAMEMFRSSWQGARLPASNLLLMSPQPTPALKYGAWKENIRWMTKAELDSLADYYLGLQRAIQDTDSRAFVGVTAVLRDIGEERKLRSREYGRPPGPAPVTRAIWGTELLRAEERQRPWPR